MTTTLAKLLAQKQKLVEELQQVIGPEERDQIERLLEQVNAALDSLEKAPPGKGDYGHGHSCRPRAAPSQSGW
jgi:chaperonin cofactor prefoldin